MTTESTALATTHPYDPAREADRWSNIKATAYSGAITTVICTLFNPITGVAVGTYFIVQIATEALLICSYKETLMKVLQTIVPCISGLVACIAVQGALIGVSAITPMLIVSAATALALNVFLMQCYSSGYRPEEN